MKTVSIRDIARHLNLSITTVSRALDGYPDVSNRTRVRILETAAEMGYVPNQAARQLRRRKTDAIGYVLSSSHARFNDPTIADTLSGLADEAAVHGVDLIVSIAPPDSDQESAIFKRLSRSQKVDGVILGRIRKEDWRVQFLHDEAMPFVAFARSNDAVDYPALEGSYEYMLPRIITHLKSEGYQRLAFIGGDADSVFHINRLEGFKEGLEANQLAYYPELVFTGNYASSAGYETTLQLLKNQPRPDAIVCISDETAFGVLHALREKKVKAGSEIGVTGFGGTAESTYSDPPLTTVDIPIYQLARQAVATLMSVIRKKKEIVIPEVPEPVLVIRQSSIIGAT
ncbi:MAG: LacI family DNA-binding transcriptional regulator [bacterium]